MMIEDETRAYAQGLIVRALGGFYYVREEGTDGMLYTCKARGLFRKDGVSPLVGDHVKIRLTGENNGFIEEICVRRNSLLRPPVANIDVLVLVVSIASPVPNLRVLDKLIAVAEHKNIEPILAVTKTDLPGDTTELCMLYRRAGFSVHALCVVNGEGVKELCAALTGRVSCFCGNSGVGKTSLLNAIDPRLTLEIGEISAKLGRGKHTTRHAQLYALPDGGYIADTPGFSAMDLSRYEVIRKEEVQYCYREFAPFLGKCRYTGCSHTREEGCAILDAAHAGQVADSRMESYQVLYEDASHIKEWELKQ